MAAPERGRRSEMQRGLLHRVGVSVCLSVSEAVIVMRVVKVEMRGGGGHLRDSKIYRVEQKKGG